MITFCYLDDPGEIDTGDFYPMFVETFSQAHAVHEKYAGWLLLKPRWQIDPDTEEPFGRAQTKITIAAFYDTACNTAVSLTWQNGAYKLVVWNGKFESVQEVSSFLPKQIEMAMQGLSEVLCLSYNLANHVSIGIENMPMRQAAALNETYAELGYGKWA
ncbi:hypothetical protein hairong_134 [Pseudomonas phage hairong]|nr:hypothetical protein hairong_134 [Pseudomonas phage hairong]